MRPATHVAAVQLAPRLGDLAHNRELTTSAIADAVAAGARRVVLPELCTSGYAFGDRDEVVAASEPVDGPSTRAWVGAVGNTDALVIAGLCERGAGGGVHNTAVVVGAGGVVAAYRKLHLWDRERLWFTPGERAAPVLDTVHGRLGIGICYDICFPELTRGLALGGAQLLAFPTNSPRLPDGAPPMETVVARATAHLNRVFVVVADRCGPERGIDWVGCSLIADLTGAVLAGPPGVVEPARLDAVVGLGDADDKSWGGRNDLWGDRRPAVYPDTLLGPVPPPGVQGRTHGGGDDDDAPGPSGPES